MNIIHKNLPVPTNSHEFLTKVTSNFPNNVSFKAMGIFLYLARYKDDDPINERKLAQVGPTGRSACRSGLKELEDAGLLERQRTHHDTGGFSHTEYRLDYSTLFPDSN